MLPLLTRFTGSNESAQLSFDKSGHFYRILPPSSSAQARITVPTPRCIATDLRNIQGEIRHQRATKISSEPITGRRADDADAFTPIGKDIT